MTKDEALNELHQYVTEGEPIPSEMTEYVVGQVWEPVAPAVTGGRYFVELDSTRGYCPRCETETHGRILRHREDDTLYFHCSGCCHRWLMVTPGTTLDDET